MIIAPTRSAANAWIRATHRHAGPVAGYLFAGALIEGGWTVGVVTVGRPVARPLDDGTTVEVTRLCLRPGVPNGCSRLYSWARREAHRRRFTRICTYTRVDEPGTSLRASGWVIHHRVKGAQWSCPSRYRPPNEVIDKWMWIPSADVGLWSPCKEGI